MSGTAGVGMGPHVPEESGVGAPGGPTSTARYDTIGVGYAAVRQPDPRIAAQIAAALGDAGSVINVGAGTGSYEPTDRPVIALDPSPVMLAQRPASAAPCVLGTAEALPFPDRAFHAALAVLTVHHWRDPLAGLAEMRRVARRCAVLTFDVAVHNDLWLVREYLPQANDLTRDVPAVSAVCDALGAARVEVVPVPGDCTDGFNWAYWRRPEHYLDPTVRRGISCLARLPDNVLDTGLARLRADLESGAWAERHGDLLTRDTVDAGLRLIVSE